MGEVGVAVVSLAQAADEVDMALEDDRIVHVGDHHGCRPVVSRLKLAAADLCEPRGMVRLAGSIGAAHYAECEFWPEL